MLTDLAYRVRWLLRRRRAESELADELQFHLDRETQKLIRRGLPPAEAARRASAALSSVESIKEDVRDAYGTRLAEDTWRDLGLAIRLMAREKRFACALVLTMALGVGANAAIVGAIDTILWRPLSVPRPQDVVAVYDVDRASNVYESISYPDFEALQRGVSSFQALAGYARRTLRLDVGVRERVIGAEEVTARYFDVMSTPPLAGRTLTPADEGAGFRVVIAEDLARELFGTPVALAVGRSVRLAGQDAVVIGVMPSGFGTEHNLGWAQTPKIWVLLRTVAALRPDVAARYRPLFENRELPFLAVMGRLRDGAAIATAERELNGVARAIRPERDSTLRPRRDISVFAASRSKFWPGHEASFTRTLGTLGVVAALILLVACASLTNLMVERASRRRHDLVVRTSLGATRQRLTRQLFMEGLAIAAPGFVVSVGVTWAMQRVLSSFPNALGMPILIDLRLTAREIGLCLMLSVVVAAAASVIPVLQSLRGHLLARGSARATVMTRSWSSQALVVLQLAFSAVLLVAALLVARGVVAAYTAPLGFDPGHLVVTWIPPRWQDDGALVPLPERVLERDAWEIPGVVDVAVTAHVPLTGVRTRVTMRDPDSGTPAFTADERYVSARFFDAMQIPIVVGEGFDRHVPGTTALVSRAMATWMWGREHPIGRAVEILRPGEGPVRLTIIGVVEDAKARDPVETPTPYVYRHITAASPQARHVVLRTAGRPADVIPEIERAWNRIVPGARLGQVATGSDLLSRSLEKPRLLAVLIGAFGVVAILLAGVGVYSTIAGRVERRSREIAVRIAIGGSPAGVGGRVFGRAMGLAGAGIAAGLAAGAAIGSRWLTLPHGVTAHDGWALGAAAALVAGVAAVAAAVPAGRASRVNPVTVLKGD